MGGCFAGTHRLGDHWVSNIYIYIYIYIYISNDSEGNTKLLIQSNILMQMTGFRKLHFPFPNLPLWENMTDNVNI